MMDPLYRECDAEGRPKIGCINKAFQLNNASFLLLKRFNILLGCKRVQYQQSDKNMTYYLILKEEESFICESAKTSSPFPSSPESPGPCPTAPPPPPQPHHHMMLEKSIATIQILREGVKKNVFFRTLSQTMGRWGSKVLNFLVKITIQ